MARRPAPVALRMRAELVPVVLLQLLDLLAAVVDAPADRDGGNDEGLGFRVQG